MEPSIERLAGRKRPFDATDDLLLFDYKVPKLEENALELSRLAETPDLDESAGTSTPSIKSNAEKQTSRLLDTLPEYVLFQLFSYLNTEALYNLSQCSPKLYNVAHSKKNLWENVIDVCNGSSPCHSRLQPFLNDCTTVLHFCKSTNFSACLAKSSKDECSQLSFFENLKRFLNLKAFIVENHSLDYNMLNLAYLPECLTELRLRGINLLNLNQKHPETFNDLHLNLPNLEVADVSYCSWVIPQMLCSFAKCSHLKKLIMLGCRGMDNIMPYAAHAADSGFLRLETLDLRLTSYISLNEIAVFKNLKNLKHIFLENAKRCKQKTIYNTSIPTCSPLLRRFQKKPARRLSNYINTWSETLVLQNYSCITDETLTEIEEFFTILKYLDVTGTKCTAEKIATIRIRCPEMRILHESLTENTELRAG